jgi:hypothetical protein
MFAPEATALFQIYDRAGVGEISKYALLSNLASTCPTSVVIDGRITEEWLNKILLEHGIPLKNYISIFFAMKPASTSSRSCKLWL